MVDEVEGEVVADSNKRRVANPDTFIKTVSRKILEEQ